MRAARRVAGATVLWLCCSIEAVAATVGYYRFEDGVANAAASGAGSIADGSGNGLNGTPIGGPVFRNSVATGLIPQTGAVNSLALDFNGTGQGVLLPDGPKFALTSSLTVEAFIYLRSVNVGGNSQILFRGDNRGGLDPYYLAVQGVNGNQLAFLIGTQANQLVGVATPLPGLNQWVHVAGVLDDNAGEMRIYVDGTLKSTLTTNARPLGLLDANQNPGVAIGNVQAPGNQQRFDGLIDEVRISDVALSPAQFLISPVDEPPPVAFMVLGIPILLAATHKRRRDGVDMGILAGNVRRQIPFP